MMPFLAIFARVPKAFWIILITAVVFLFSNLYNRQKGYDEGIAHERQANRTASDAALITSLDKTNSDLERAVKALQEGTRRANELRQNLSSSQVKIQELQEQLNDAKETIHPDCSKLSPERYRLYQSISEKPSPTGKD